MLEKIAKFREYLDYVERHYLNVQKAWELLQDKCPRNSDFYFQADDVEWDLINDDVKRHDESKLSAEEFTKYRQWFFPAKGEERDKEQFKNAWAHHKRHNMHHWQTWTQSDGNPYASAYLTMMIIDWVAMGFEFGDTAKDYYEKNKNVIDLPEWAVKYMYTIFDAIYPEYCSDPLQIDLQK
jgi:hypothetical protein